VLAEEQEALQALAAERLLALANEKDSLALQLKALDESRRLAIESIAERFGQEEACLMLFAW
jgi:flagellar biosynthesis/type III secretory pathway chaperone